MNKLKKNYFITKTIQLFSKNLAVKFALKVFKAPIVEEASEREYMMRKSAHQETVRVEAIAKDINVISYGYSQKRVLLVNDWNGRPTQFYTIADKLLENGYMIYSFDTPTQNNFKDKILNLFELDEIIKALHHKFDGFTCAIGHSLGGLALYNTSSDLNLKSLVSINTPQNMLITLKSFIKTIGLKPELTKVLKQQIEQDLNFKLEDYPSNSSKNLKTPTLIIHDRNDDQVPIQCAHDIKIELENATSYYTQSFGHNEILKQNSVAEKIIAFIKDND